MPKKEGWLYSPSPTSSIIIFLLISDFSFLAVLHKSKEKKHIETTDLSNVQLTKRWVCNTAQAWSMHPTPDTGLQLYACSQALQQKKRCFAKGHPGSGLILILVICPSNCVLSSTGRMKWRYIFPSFWRKLHRKCLWKYRALPTTRMAKFWKITPSVAKRGNRWISHRLMVEDI